MPTLGLIGIVLLVLVLLGALAPRVFAAAPPPKPPAPQAAPAEPQVPAPSLKELQERLAKLAKSEPPTKLHPAAMCYKPAAQPQTADYVCPVDGSRTQYARASGMVDFVRSLPSMRLAATQLRGLDASLDERAMCRKCSPKGEGGVALVVKHADGKVVRTESVRDLDLQILKEFLDGSLTHTGRFGDESPLKDHLPRIHQLLGIPEK